MEDNINQLGRDLLEIHDRFTSIMMDNMDDSDNDFRLALLLFNAKLVEAHSLLFKIKDRLDESPGVVKKVARPTTPEAPPNEVRQAFFRKGQRLIMRRSPSHGKPYQHSCPAEFVPLVVDKLAELGAESRPVPANDLLPCVSDNGKPIQKYMIYAAVHWLISIEAIEDHHQRFGRGGLLIKHGRELCKCLAEEHWDKLPLSPK